MNDTPETQKVFDWFYSRNADRASSFIGINRVQSRMEDMERERDEARLQAKLLRVENNHNWQANDLAEQAFRERDEARNLAYKLYWAAWDLKRFARAYAGGYKEADDKEGVAKAEEDFYEACKDLVDVLGMDDE